MLDLQAQGSGLLAQNLLIVPQALFAALGQIQEKANPGLHQHTQPGPAIV
jgi:hypothetical protein